MEAAEQRRQRRGAGVTNTGKAGAWAAQSGAGNRQISPFFLLPVLGEAVALGVSMYSIAGRALPEQGGLGPPLLTLLPGDSCYWGAPGGGAREGEGGLVTKLEKEKLQLSAGGLWGVHSHARKHRTGSTAKYLYRRKQAAQQLDVGACQGPPPAPRRLQPRRLEESPHRNPCPCPAAWHGGEPCPLPTAHGSSAHVPCPWELALPPSAKAGEDRFPISPPQLQTLPGLPRHGKGSAQLSPPLWD